MEVLEPNCLGYIIPMKYPFMIGACNSLRIARIKLREGKATQSSSCHKQKFYTFVQFWNALQ